MEKSQLIGISANTGYSAFPHLHFEVVGNDGSGNYRQPKIQIQTKGSSIYDPHNIKGQSIDKRFVLEIFNP